MTNIRKALLALALAAPLAATGMAVAQAGPGGPPPAPRFERGGPSPYPDGFYIRGHYRWEGGAYVWEGGRWEHRPHPRAVWVGGRWHRGPGGYVWKEGYWR